MYYIIDGQKRRNAMTNPLNLFINPDEWKCVHSYGDEKQKPPLVTSYALLETKADGKLYAAVPGKLSTRLPGSGVDPDINLTEPASDITLPATVNLYLHATKTQKLPGIGDIIGFAYLNIETATLRASLGVGTTRVRKLVLGELSVTRFGGELIGKAAKETYRKRQVGFAALTKDGPVDPGYVYKNTNKAPAGAKAHQLVNLLRKNWPIVKSRNKDDTINITKVHLYPMPVLLDMHKRHSMNTQDWRKVGDNQKKLWRKLLLKHAGYALRSNVSPFDFNLLDWHNIFQLEALIEFYVNFDAASGGRERNLEFNTPWKPGAKPLDCVRDKDKYITVNFLDLKGENARKERVVPPSGIRLELDGEPDLSRVKENHNTIYLYDTSFGISGKKAYLIEKVEATNIIKLQGTPTLPAGPFKWHISLSPAIVLIDPFGPRIKGKQATLLSDVYHYHPKKVSVKNNIVRLADCSKEDLIMVNRYFDTIYFPSDTTDKHRYRIIDRDVDTSTIILDRPPKFRGGVSAWQIQAGVCNEMPPLYYNLGSGSRTNYKDYPNRNGVYGYDHFDGILFIVKNGKIHAMYRWCSFTSRINAGNPQWLSSIQGNREYDVFSRISSPDKCHLNYGFSVVEKDNRNTHVDDFVRYARFYFRETVADDSETRLTHRPSTRNHRGKNFIRFHWSRSRIGQLACENPRWTSCERQRKIRRAIFMNSAGCLVSPLFELFRAKMIDLHQEDYEARKGSRDTSLDNIKGLLQHINSENHFKSNRSRRSHWHGKLRATLWLIRPDERPVG